MNQDQAAQLRQPFKQNEIEYLQKSGVNLAYVSHARVTDRLLAVDPDWTYEPVATNERGAPLFDGDGDGRPVGLWIRLTVHGVTRLGYGSVEYRTTKNGDVIPSRTDAIKMIVSDALRNAAMRFGVALDLWTKEVGDDVVSVSQDTTRPVPQTSPKPASLPVTPSGHVAQNVPVTKPATGDDALLGQSIGKHEHEDTPSGNFIIKRSRNTGKLYAQCNGKTGGKYCNAFPPYGALDTWIDEQKSGDVDPDSVPDSVGENVSLPEAVKLNNHHAEFINAVLDAEYGVGRPWIKGFDNDRLIAFAEHIVDTGKVAKTIVTKAHYGDRADLSRNQLLELADTLYVAYARATGKVTQDEIDLGDEEIPFG